ncbi:PREDICTED: uncharacterized protein LOC104754661 [Camelina sativa]|uniref:Uncharacterized protein LOC104754661 n=1 Tax=Camelina sativa TaxID=90675 RepID=A0ABM0WRP3_CAMSA|nr:PREDICTED: uncharacterized protein LOC104754661 [Camelina sativa]
MDRNDHEEEEDTRVHEDDDFDVDISIMVVMMTVGAQIHNTRQQLTGGDYIERPIRRPVTQLGEEYIQKVLKDDPEDFRVLYRMIPDMFLKLSRIIRDKTGLQNTKKISVEEMLAVFMLTVGQNARYGYVKNTFQRSKFAVSTSFNKILKALLIIAPSQMVKPDGLVPLKIRESTRFYPYFKNCVGAIDGTHIPATVVGREVASYRNRKGTISQNVLAVCNFDLEFIYILSGWEGSAHDSRVLSDALTRGTNKFQVPNGKFYLVDSGFANRLSFLAPFRGVKYHLQEFAGQGRDPETPYELFNLRHASLRNEFAGQGRDPETPYELFNLRHASLRNVIERIFGIFKSRFAIFKTASPFSYKKQAGLVLACAGLHNFLRRECRSDEGVFPNENNAVNNGNNSVNIDESEREEPLETQEQDRENANNWRQSMAEDMWKDATI